MKSGWRYSFRPFLTNLAASGTGGGGHVVVGTTGQCGEPGVGWGSWACEEGRDPECGHQRPLQPVSGTPCPPSGKGPLGEQLFTDPAGVLGGRHRVAHGPRVGEDLVVIPAWHGFVPEEIDGLIAVIFHMSQAIPLVPAIRKDINADLASYGECDAFSCKLFLQFCYELLSDIFFLRRARRYRLSSTWQFRKHPSAAGHQAAHLILSP